MGRAPCCEEGLKKGPWSSQEDNKLLQYILENGTGNWKMLPKQAGLQRCGKSCRLRWTNYLRPGIKRGNFTCEEEQAILQLHCKLGNKWSAIAARLPGRTDNEIKNFWNTHLKKRLLQMGIDPVTHRPHLDLLTPSFSSFFAFQSAQAKLPIQYDNLMSYNMLRSQYKLDEAAANLWAQQHLGDSLIYNAQNLDHHFFQPRFTMTGWNGDIERTQQPNFTTMGYSNYSAMDRASIDASLASCLANDTTTLNPQLGILFDKVGRDQNMSMEKVFYQGEYDQNCNNLLLSTDSEAVNSDLVWPNSLPPLLSYSGSLTPDNSSGTVADTQSDSSPNGYGQPLPSEHFMNIAINNEEGRDYWSNVVNFMDTIPTGP